MFDVSDFAHFRFSLFGRTSLTPVPPVGLGLRLHATLCLSFCTIYVNTNQEIISRGSKVDKSPCLRGTPEWSGSPFALLSSVRGGVILSVMSACQEWCLRFCSGRKEIATLIIWPDSICQLAGAAVKACACWAWSSVVEHLPGDQAFRALGFHPQNPGKDSVHFRSGKEAVSLNSRTEKPCKTFVTFMHTCQE